MYGPKPEPLTLSDVKRNELERLVRRHGTPNNWRAVRANNPGSRRMEQ